MHVCLCVAGRIVVRSCEKTECAGVCANLVFGDEVCAKSIIWKFAPCALLFVAAPAYGTHFLPLDRYIQFRLAHTFVGLFDRELRMVR